MKKYIKSLAALLAAAALLPVMTSCEGDQALPPMPLPEGIFNEEGVIGDGTWENPLTVYQASLGTLPEGMTDVWVTGYVVGWVDSSIGQTLNEKCAVFTSPASVKSNVLLAQVPPQKLEELYVVRDADGKIVSDTRWEHCITVQLVYDTAPRPAINLGDNPDVLGRQVSIYGQTNVKYFGVYGLKFTSEYNWGPKGKYVAPKVPGVFEKADEFIADKEYLIAQGSQIAKMLTAERGYLYMSDVAVTNGQISLASVANAFTFEATESGVRIRQSDGLYFIADATDVAMHLTDNPEQAGCYFTVTASASEPGRFTIVSRLNNKSLLFDTQYTSFGLYDASSATGKGLPELYVRIK